MSMSNLARVAPLFALSTTACIGSLAPHLSRESELAPPAAAGRHSTVLQRAAAFEKQNATSKDVHWYRTWRAAAMVGLGQYAEAQGLLEQILTDISLAKSTPAQPERLRMFILDLQAGAAMGQGQATVALERLDQAFTLAQRVELESDGGCDRDLVLASRARQIEVVANQAGNVPRARRARETLAARTDAWVKCKRLEDYLALGSLDSLGAAVRGASPGAPAAVAPAAPSAPAAPAAPAKAPAPPPPAPPVAPPPPVAPARPAGPPRTPAALPVANVRYAPVNAAPYQAGLDAIAPLIDKRARGARTDVMIRTDGAHHALRVSLARPEKRLEALLPVFRSAVVFFERTRAVKPGADRVLVVTGGVTVIAEKSAIMELFLERIDAEGFLGRLRRLP